MKSMLHHPFLLVLVAMFGGMSMCHGVTTNNMMAWAAGMAVTIYSLWKASGFKKL